MKKLLLAFLIICCFTSYSHAQNPLLIFSGVPESAEAPTPVWTETFDLDVDSGCDHTPITLTGDADYTGDQCDGTDSVYLDSNEAWKGDFGSGYSDLYIAFCVTFLDYRTWDSDKVVSITTQDSSNNILVSIYPYKTASDAADWRVLATGGTEGSNSITATENTTYKILIHYTAGSGSNALIEAWVTTDGNFSGGADISSSDGTATANAQRFAFYMINQSYNDGWADGVKVYTSKPGSY